MTKVISAVIVILVLYGAWELWLYWDKYNTDKDLEQRQAAASVIRPEQLPGMPSGLEDSYRAAERNGVTGVKNWLKTYGRLVQDPRRGWIELDYMILIAREDPAEARRIFSEVRNRTPESSPIYPRIKKLQATYQ